MRKYRISLIATIIAVAITSFFIYLRISITGSTGPFSMDWSISLPDEDTAFGGLFYDPEISINDTIPHYEYRSKVDSLKRISDEKQLSNKSFGSGISYGAFGFSFINKEWGIVPDSIFKKDPMIKLMDDSLNTINKKWALYYNNSDSIRKFKEMLGEIMWRYNVRNNEILHERDSKGQKLYYISLSGYNADHDIKFFVQNEKYNLAYVKWDSVIKRKFDSTQVGHYERKQIPVRYSTDEKKVLIPISNKKYIFLNSLSTILYYVFLFSMTFILFGLPVQILIDISRGKAFTKNNINRFKVMALVLLVYTVLKILAPYILNFIYRKQIPDELQLEPFHYGVINNLYLFLIAIALFIIGKAFQKGYNLQEEEELTV